MTSKEKKNSSINKELTADMDNNQPKEVIRRLEGEEDAMVQDGFSSEEEVKQERIEIVQDRKGDQAYHPKDQFKFKIPPAQSIQQKPRSLHPDTVTGWRPKIQLPNPIPLIFDNHRSDRLMNCLLKDPHPKARICYLGPRPSNTFWAWQGKPFNFPYSHVKATSDSRASMRKIGDNHLPDISTLQFNSDFEEGNLDMAIQISDYQYDLFIRVDANTNGHLQWFNFKVKNMQKLQKYKFNICNFQKFKSLYGRGSKPYSFSLRRFQKEGKQWQQIGQSIRYDRKSPYSAKLYEIEQYIHNKFVLSSFSGSYKLSFQFYTCYENDQFQLAYCIPYTYSQLETFLQDLASRNQTKPFVKKTKLCNSLGGLEVPLLIIHEDNIVNQFGTQGLKVINKKDKQENSNKKCIMICGRAHPGESNGSYMLQGFIEYLCGQNKQAQLLRKNVIFKIVPMLNPDGVVMGNYRTGLPGRDFNRQYSSPDKIVFPQVFAFKKLVTQNKIIFKDRLIIFLDFHGHSVKKNTFVYGPEFPIIDRYYYESRILPKIISSKTSMFRYYSCVFKISDFKSTTARAVLLRKLFIPLSYTIQTSNGSFFDYQKLKDVPYTSALWKQMGFKVGEAVAQYVALLLRTEIIKEEKRVKRASKAPSIEIRKVIRVKSNKPTSPTRSLLRNDNQSIFMAALEDQKIKALFEDIKKAQQQKIMHQISEDQLSQGSSDGQGQQDDLSVDKRDILIRMIKCKKQPDLQFCRIKLSDSRSKTNFSQDDIKDTQKCEQQPQLISPEKDPSFSINSLPNESQEIFFNNKKQRKVPILRQRIFSEDKKTTTARIINFNFEHSPRTRPHDEKLDKIMKLNYMEAVSGKLLDQQGWNPRKETQSIRLGALTRADNHGRVLDLSEGQFTQSFVIGYQQQQQLNERKNNSPTGVNNFPRSPNGHPPRKMNRLESYKMRRMGPVLFSINDT